LNVVTRGNIIIKATEGMMQRAGGTYERNVSINTELAGLIGQAIGVMPTPNGVVTAMRDNLFLNARGDFIFGNVASGTVLRNLFINTTEGTTTFGLALNGLSTDWRGSNIGVHNTVFSDNVLNGAITRYPNPGTAEDFSELTFNANVSGAIRGVSFAEFMTAAGIAGTTIDDYGRYLIGRDRASFSSSHRAEPLINFYRTPRSLALLQ
jgi:hypothetical protein